MIQSRCIFLTLLSVYFIADLAGTIFVKRWADDNDRSYLVAGLAFYFICSLCWAWSLRFECLTRASAIYPIYAMISGIILGVFWCKERITTINGIGIVFGLISIILVLYGGHDPE